MTEKSYVYTEKELTQALKILRRKSRTRLPCIIIFSILSLLCILRGICILLSAKGEAYGEIIVSSLLFAAAILLFFSGRYCAEAPFTAFADYNPPDGHAREHGRFSSGRYVHHRSSQRTVSVERHCIRVTAEFAAYDSGGTLAKSKTDTRKYRPEKCKVYENDNIFLFHAGGYSFDAIPKSIFTAQERRDIGRLFHPIEYLR